MILLITLLTCLREIEAAGLGWITHDDMHIDPYCTVSEYLGNYGAYSTAEECLAAVSAAKDSGVAVDYAVWRHDVDNLCHGCDISSRSSLDLVYLEDSVSFEYTFICPDMCESEPCECDEVATGCYRYQFDYGCESCKSGYFLVNEKYPCMECQDLFGMECLECSDGIGCIDCDSGYGLVYSEECDLTYCESVGDTPDTPAPTEAVCPTQCNNSPCDCDEVSNCQVCNQGSGCGQCNSGYFKVNDNYNCMNCQDYAGVGCKFCQDGNGCGQCDQGYTRVKNECDLFVCE